MAILTLNAGSSSLKFALFDGDRAVLRGEVEDITGTPKTSVKDAQGKELDPPHANGPGHEAVLPVLFDWVGQHSGKLEAVGHRVVHGGDRFDGPVRVDDGVIAGIEALTEYAPLHQGHNLAAIRAVLAVRPGLAQVACFDTAFHRSMPEVARTLPLPPRLGLRRYGFHGLSYEYIAGRLSPKLAAGRVVVAHLGSGASLCALASGRSVETTMSTTPLDGLIMGTRCGALDPGVVLLLMRRGMDVGAVEHLLYYEAGLLGLSGVSGDMRALHAAGSEAADRAVELFAYRIASETGAMVAALGGVDGFVFTGGIGEHDRLVRGMVVKRLAWLGLALAADALSAGRVSPDGAKVEVWVIPTDEEAVIARQTRSIVGGD
jgi:acetate kinase